MKPVKVKKLPKKKNTAPQSVDKSLTIRSLHNETISKLSDAHAAKRALLLERYQLLSEENERMSAIPVQERSADVLDRIFQIESQMAELDAELKQLEVNRALDTYHLKSGRILADYIGEWFHERDPIHSSTEASGLSEYFVHDDNGKTKEDLDKDARKQASTSTQTGLAIDAGLQSGQRELLHAYYKTIDPNYVGNLADYEVNIDVCTRCRSSMTFLSNTSVMRCTSCGMELPIQIDNEPRSHKEPPKEIGGYYYRRVVHFNELMRQLQGLESPGITPEILERILNELSKETYLTKDQITLTKIRNVLRTLGLTSYNEHANYILCKVTGKPPQRFDDDFINVMRSDFAKVQGAWLKICPDDRNNFFSYPYVFYKLCEMKGRTEYLPLCKSLLLKGDDKLREHDDLWRDVCTDLNWTFKRTYC